MIMTRSRASVEDAAYEQSNAEELGPGNIMPVARECSIASPTDGNTAAGAFGDRGGNKIAFGMKRTQRRYIAEAFERYVDINSDPA